MKYIKNYNDYDILNEGLTHNIVVSSILLLSSLVGLSQTNSKVNLDEIKSNISTLKDSGSKNLDSLADKNIKTLSELGNIQKLINIDSLNIPIGDVDKYLNGLDSLDHNINMDLLNTNLDSLYKELDKNISESLLKGYDSSLVNIKNVLKDIYNRDDKKLISDLNNYINISKSNNNSSMSIILISVIILIIGTLIYIKLS